MQEHLSEHERRDRVAQWAFDTRPILGRMHLWLEDVDVEWIDGVPVAEFTRDLSFMDGRMERLIAMTTAVTALGTRLFGRFGEGSESDKKKLNRVKKDADAISAYAMSESLWYASRSLPENHAILVSLGEGLMPKSGETEEMGSNPQLGFGRVYARPQVARWLDERVTRLLNEDDYQWDDFWSEIKDEGLTVWGAAIDTLENTGRFAKGAETGPMTLLHLFNQPLHIVKPYEGYMGTLFFPREVGDVARDRSVLLDFKTPRRLLVESIEGAYPGIQREHIHVWTLRGKSRVGRLGKLWREWQELGVHLVDDDWVLPSGIPAFTDSGTYAPVYRVGGWLDQRSKPHVFIVDGYAASAEAMQAISLTPVLDIEGSLVVFTSTFELPVELEQHVMGLEVSSGDFPRQIERIMGLEVDPEMVEAYKARIMEAQEAGIPRCTRVLTADDFFPEKGWDVIACSGYMCDDPYSGARGVEEIGPNLYRTTVRLATPHGDKLLTFTLRMMERPDEGRLVFNPLLIRFLYGEDFEKRPVKISDSGRIRNELQTLCSEALDHLDDGRIRLQFDCIPAEVISKDDQVLLRRVLIWYKEHHPLWFDWLEID